GDAWDLRRIPALDGRRVFFWLQSSIFRFSWARSPWMLAVKREIPFLMRGKKKILALLGALALLGHQSVRAKDAALREGDIIFQVSRSSQSLAIQLATKSPYSHMGLIQKDGSHYFVYEAVQPVKRTPLEDWIRRGEGGHYVVKRLKEADRLLTPEVLAKI